MQVLDGLAGRIVEAYLPLLHRLLDNLALLDMLAAFAQVAGGSSGQYVRPVLTEAGEQGGHTFCPGGFLDACGTAAMSFLKQGVTLQASPFSFWLCHCPAAGPCSSPLHSTCISSSTCRPHRHRGGAAPGAGAAGGAPVSAQ